ncbi:MAG: polyprenyl synthetase family protein, partial [Candidatus Sumerlaeota bacterium]|nr:polyprenyl synthetase family protein [Candidatus Sumerlaeota bacterium]
LPFGANPDRPRLLLMGNMDSSLPLSDQEARQLKDYLLHARRRVLNYLDRPKYWRRFGPDEIRDHHFLYLRAGGKALRPALLLTACQAAGGDPKLALPAACAVEVFHVWSLVHDDILDRDELRRGQPTVHAFARQRLRELNLTPMTPAERDHLANGMAILVGDNLLAFALALLNELHGVAGVAPEVAAWLAGELATTTINGLIEGEMLDCLFEKRPLESLSADDALDMLRKKTGCLLEFCMAAGVMIALNRRAARAPEVKAARAYARHCGLAFQLQDDLLGLTGDEKELSKPVGADVRAGKRTPIFLFAYEAANERQRARIRRTLGHPNLSNREVAEFIAFLESLGALDRARSLAHGEIAAALKCLDAFPPSPARDRLASLARFMIQRDR